MLRRFVRGLVRFLAAALVIAAVVAYAVINGAGHYPARWHNDPATIALRGTPNEFLAASIPGLTEATPHLLYVIHRTSPRALLACFDGIARARPRVTVVASDVDHLMITYVQRSRLVGFPDYITVKAVEHETETLEAGAALIVYSRSRYGRGDFGVNEKRVVAWLKQSGSIC